MRHLSRIGCMARAALYFSIGVLAFLVAVGSSYGETTDEGGVLRHLDHQFGHYILIILGLGLFSYALWRFAQALHDLDRYGRSVRALSIRTGFFLSGLAHFGLGVYALAIVAGIGRQGAFREKVMARWLLLQPFGRQILLLIGLSIITTGLIQFLRAANNSFLRNLQLPKSSHRTIVRLCRFGFVARGIIFILIGIFFLNAAWKSRSREVGGLHKAWETLRGQPFGSFLLAVVAGGFMAFAVFAFIEGFYRKPTASFR